MTSDEAFLFLMESFFGWHWGFDAQMTRAGISDAQSS
jgi:hypothetical protein